MKRFHLSGTADYSWLLQVDAETEEEAKEKAAEMVRAGDVGDDRISYVVIEECDEEKGYDGENE